MRVCVWEGEGVGRRGRKGARSGVNAYIYIKYMILFFLLDLKLRALF